MDKRDILNINKHLREYHEQGSLNPPRKNQILLSSANTSLHELAKAVVCWKGQIGVNFTLFKKEIECLKVISEIIEKDRKHGKRNDLLTPDQFITEAIEYKTKKRRDIVFLKDNEKVEIINTHLSDAILEEYEKDGVYAINLNNVK